MGFNTNSTQLKQVLSSFILFIFHNTVLYTPRNMHMVYNVWVTHGFCSPECGRSLLASGNTYDGRDIRIAEPNFSVSLSKHWLKLNIMFIFWRCRRSVSCGNTCQILIWFREFDISDGKINQQSFIVPRLDIDTGHSMRCSVMFVTIITSYGRYYW